MQLAKYDFVGGTPNCPLRSSGWHDANKWNEYTAIHACEFALSFFFRSHEKKEIMIIASFANTTKLQLKSPIKEYCNQLFNGYWVSRSSSVKMMNGINDVILFMNKSIQTIKIINFKKP